MSETYRYTPQESAAGRERIVKILRASVEREFARTPRWKSAFMMVAQYWNDNADDAVHCAFVFSDQAVPKPEDAEYGSDTEEPYANVEMRISNLVHEPGGGWDENGEAISLFAAFAKDGCHQEMSLHEAYVPYALFTRAPGGGADVQVVGKKIRPWLDGVRPSWDRSEAVADLPAVPAGALWVIVTDIVDDFTVTLEPRDIALPSSDRPLVMRVVCPPEGADAVDRFEVRRRPVAIYVGQHRFVGRVRTWSHESWTEIPERRQLSVRLIVDISDDSTLHDDLVRCQQELDPKKPEDQSALVRIDAELARLGR
jgi:hypothetical protein